MIVAFFNLADGNDNAFAERVISHMKLDGTTASLVHDLFGSTSNNLLAATLTIVIGFLLWGVAIGQLYQDLYARVWRIHVGGVADQLRFTIWFFVTAGLVALMTVSTAKLRSDGWLVLVPAWIAGSTIFWLWTPRFLLHRMVPLRSLLPGALLAAFVLGGTVATSPLWIGPTINQKPGPSARSEPSSPSSPTSSSSSPSRWPAPSSRPSGPNGGKPSEVGDRGSSVPVWFQRSGLESVAVHPSALAYPGC